MPDLQKVGGGIRRFSEGLQNCSLLLEYGADEVFVYDQEELRHFRIEPYTAVLEDFIRNNKPSSVLVGGTQSGRSLAPGRRHDSARD